MLFKPAFPAVADRYLHGPRLKRYRLVLLKPAPMAVMQMCAFGAGICGRIGDIYPQLYYITFRKKTFPGLSGLSIHQNIRTGYAVEKNSPEGLLVYRAALCIISEAFPR